MKYIIMCGGTYPKWETPRHLTEINGESIVARTIRLLRLAGVKDIAISATSEHFNNLGVPVLKHTNNFIGYNANGGYWVDAFYPMNEPVCYLLGDVVFSDEAIQTIVNTHTDDIEFFASAPPFANNYYKPYAEPFAFKVVNTEHFKQAIAKTKQLQDRRMFKRVPIAWELWQVIKGTEINKIDYTNYTAINDYTCDIDDQKDVEKIKEYIPKENNMARYMIHAMPKRMWYVEEYLIPSLLEQGIKQEQIQVYNDSKGEGNLRACLNAFAMCDGEGGTWHLQDDVCICEDFKTITEAVDFGLVCGFSSELYDGKGRVGSVDIKNMWFSFPCIRIPNEYARECAKWVDEYIIGNPVYREYWVNGVNDDWAFRTYLREFHKQDKAINISPNLVDHVDFLLGGGTGKKQRTQSCRAQYLKEGDKSVIRLEEKLWKANRL